jgi:hypothetical protein
MGYNVDPSYIMGIYTRPITAPFFLCTGMFVNSVKKTGLFWDVSFITENQCSELYSNNCCRLNAFPFLVFQFLYLKVRLYSAAVCILGWVVFNFFVQFELKCIRDLWNNLQK